MKKVLFPILILFLAFSLKGQVDYPYLQAPTDNSIWVTWQTSSGTGSIVEYGTSPNNLNNTVSGSHDAITSSWIWHKVRLQGLQPNTAYYYRVKTGTQVSAVKRFRTQPALNTSTGHYRFIIIGDHQSGDDRFGRVIDAAKQKAEAKFGTPVEDKVNLLLFAGDMVETGGSINQWTQRHFSKTEPLSGNIPSAHVVGNHDRGGSYGSIHNNGGNIGLYSRLFIIEEDADFHYEGIQPAKGDNFYAFQVANVVFACLNSNVSWSDQTNWVSNLVNTVHQDNNVEWLISDAHHPILAEQLPGDASSYMRNDIAPHLNATDKFVMYISGHAHLYARGAFRENPAYHVINGGASHDQIWHQGGNFIDYEDVQKTIPRHLYQIVDIDLDNRAMTVETYSTGYSNGQGTLIEDRLIDTYYRKLDANKPNKPSVTSVPNEVTLPYEFSSSQYQGNEPYNSTEFQFAGPNGDFSNPVLSTKRDFENWFWDGSATHSVESIDLNDGVDIFKLLIKNGELPTGLTHLRIRHRDQSMHWSDWSDPVSFTVLAANNEDGPIAYFPFNGNVKDYSVAGKDFDSGINTRATFQIDPNRGDVLSMDNNDIVTIQSGADAKDGLPISNMTVMGWVKVNAADTWGGFVGLLQDNGSSEFGWVLGTRNQKFSFALAGEYGTGLTYLIDDENFNLNQWYHVAASYDGATMRLYVNGIEKAVSNLQSGQINYPSGWFVIGSYKDNNEDFRHDGLLDEIAIWNRTLSPFEIQSAYLSPQSLIDKVAYYKYNNNALDASVNQLHGTENGINFEQDQLHGAVASFNNTGYIDVQTGANASENLPYRTMTVATWVKVDAADTWGGFVGLIHDNGSDESGWVLGTRGQKFSFALSGTSNPSLTYLEDNQNFNLGEWYHLTATYDGTTMRLYVNGEERTTSTAQSGPIEYPNSGWFTLGRYKDSNEDFRHDGSLNNTVIWNRVLSAQEIQDLAGQIEVVAYYKYNGNPSDASVNALHGLDKNVVYEQDGVQGQIANFNNTGYIDIQVGENAAANLPIQDITIATWVKVDAADTWGGFVGLIHDNGSDESGWVLGTRGQKFSFALSGTSNPSLTYLEDNQNFNLEQWYHLTATYDGTTMRLYVDGVEKVHTTTQSGPIEYPNSGWFTLGRYKDSNEDHRHNGCLNNTIIWDRVLSASEISNLAASSQNATIPTINAPTEQMELQLSKEKNNVELAEDMVIYPNPISTGFFKVLLPKEKNFKELNIYNAAGKLIQNVDITDKNLNIDVTGWDSGTYLLVAKSADNIIYQKQFVVLN